MADSFAVGQRVRRKARADGWVSLTQAGFVRDIALQEREGLVQVEFDTLSRPSKARSRRLWVPVRQLEREDDG